MRLRILAIMIIITFVRPVTAIVGGEPVSRDAWPTVVFISQGCTGTLIHPELVVFAAHCGSDIDYISFGQNVERLERRVKTVKCDVFEENILKNGTDVAYCRLAEPQILSLVTPLSDREAYFLRPGLSATLVGFGLDDDGKMGVKHAAESAIRCLTPRGEMFIGGGGVDSCAGDSGGPAFVLAGEGQDAQWRLAGIASYGSVCGAGGYYARIDRVVEWLESETGLDMISLQSTPTMHDTDDVHSSGSCGGLGTPGESQSCPAKPVGIDDVPPRIRIIDSSLEYDHEKKWAVLRIEVHADDPAEGCGVVMIGVSVDGQIKAPRAPKHGEIRLKLHHGVHNIEIFAQDRAHNRSTLVFHSVVVDPK